MLGGGNRIVKRHRLRPGSHELMAQWGEKSSNTSKIANKISARTANTWCCESHHQGGLISPGDFVCGSDVGAEI